MNRLAIIGVLALLLAGCGTGSNGDEAASGTTAACQPLPGVSLDAQKSSANENREVMYLTSVSEDTEYNGCSAIVDFAFEPQAPGPGYEVSYQPASTAKIEDGSGKTIEIEGNAFLVVKLSPAMTAKVDGDEATKTYTGPNRVQSDVPSFVKEIVKTGDFEGVLTWVIGLDRKLPFKAYAGKAGFGIDIDGS